MSAQFEQVMNALRYLADHPNAVSSPAVHKNVDIDDDLLSPLRSRVRRAGRYVAKLRNGKPTQNNAGTPQFPKLQQDTDQVAQILDALVVDPNLTPAKLETSIGVELDLCKEVRGLVRKFGQNS